MIGDLVQANFALTRRNDHHWYRVVNCRCNPMNIADKAAVVDVRAITSDTDNVSARRNARVGRVPAGGVAKGRVSAASGVEAAGRVVTECSETGSCIGAAGSVVKSANTPLAVLFAPVVLFKNAPTPVAVFASAVLAKSAPAPMAVLKLPVRLL